MLENPCFERACDLLLSQVSAVGMEQVSLSECGGRVLAQDLIAQENVPTFDRSPYDGYAVCAADTAFAAKEHPVTLRVLEEVPAGAVPTQAKVALLSTGSELVEADAAPGAGKIRNSNRYMLEAALKQIGCEPVYLGIAGDSVADISARLNEGLAECDALVTTGGVSVGDYDLTPAAMERCGAETLFRGVDMKPGMACAYGVKEGKLICGLSGNPASALTNFYAVALPVLKKLTGRNTYLAQEIQIRLSNGFSKKSPKTRFLRGKLELKDGAVCMQLPKDQGNVVLSSTIGCDVMAVVPAGSGPLEAGTVLKGFLL